MEKQYVKSERAHYMCPNMHFGIMITIEAAYSFIKVRETIERISEAHPFLNCLMQYEDGSSGLFYSNKNKMQAELCERESVQMMWDDYKGIGKKSWNIFEQGLLKVLIYPLAEGFKVLFVAHHLLGDGRCLLELACEFTDTYVEGKVPVYVEENLIKGIEDLPDQTELTGISRLLVHRLNRKWKKENRI